MRYVCLFALIHLALSAQDGAAIYKERCASCHDMPAARVPSLSAIKAMSGEAIYMALTRGVMKTRAEGLSTAQIFALIGYIAPTGGTHAAATPASRPPAKATGVFATQTHRNGTAGAPRLPTRDSRTRPRPDSPPPMSRKLKLKWAFNLGDVTVARSQPAVVGRSRVHCAPPEPSTHSTPIPAVRAGDSRPRRIRRGVTVGDANGTPAVFFADAGATVYALNAQTGELIWKVRPVDHFATVATATPRFYKGVVYQPFASFEEAARPRPKFECCTFRGSVVALDAGNGKKLWQTFTIPDAAKPTGKSPHGNAAARSFGRGRLVEPDHR